MIIPCPTCREMVPSADAGMTVDSTRHSHPAPRFPDRNMWGTLKADIDPAEYCVECEQRTDLGHYDTCPTRIGSPAPGGA